LRSIYGLSIIFNLAFFTCIISRAAADEPAKAVIVDNAPQRLAEIRPKLMSTNFSPDGKFLVTTAGSPTTTYDEPGELTVWDLKTRAKTLVVRQEQTIRSAAFSPDSKQLAMCDFAGNTRILDPTSGKTLVTLPVRNALVNMVRFTNDGKFLVACGF